MKLQLQGELLRYEMHSHGLGDEGLSMTHKITCQCLCLYLKYKVAYAESINFFLGVGMGSLALLATYFMAVNGM